MRRWVPAVLAGLAVAIAGAGVLRFIGWPGGAERGVVPDARTHEVGRWERRSDTRRGAIVFVHGGLSDPRTAWTAPNGAYWPRLVVEDPAFADFDVHVYGYYTPPFKPAQDIPNLAKSMYDWMRGDDGIGRYDEVIFVTHSMGGPVTRAALMLLPDERASRVAMLMMFASPNRGADVMNLMSRLSRNPQPDNVASHAGYVDGLLTQWQELRTARRWPVRVYCGVETRKENGIIVVGEASATSGCDAWTRFDMSHGELVKPTDASHRSHVELRQRLAQMRELRQKDGTKDIDRLLDDIAAELDLPQRGVDYVLRSLENLLRNAPDKGDAHYLLAVAQVRKGLPAEAANHYRRCVELDCNASYKGFAQAQLKLLRGPEAGGSPVAGAALAPGARATLVSAMFGEDKKGRMAATANVDAYLASRADAGDAELVRLLLGEAGRRPEHAAGIINTLLVLQRVPPRQLRSFADTLNPLLDAAQARGGEQTRLQVAAVRARLGA